MIRDSVEILVRHVHEHRLHFRFIARERYSGVPALRQAIRTEIRLFTQRAGDRPRRASRSSTRWSTEDLHVIAGLIVNAMVSTAEEIIDAPRDTPEAEEEVDPARREAAAPDRARRPAVEKRNLGSGARNLRSGGSRMRGICALPASVGPGHSTNPPLMPIQR